MNSLTALKIGDNLNITLNGKLFNKKASDSPELLELIKIFHKTKTDDVFNKIVNLVDAKKRLIKYNILEHDDVENKFYLKDFNKYPIPNVLLKVMIDYLENDFPVEPIINFWKLLMSNEDERVINDLFKFMEKYNFSITDHGYGVAYKYVELTNGKKTENKNVVLSATGKEKFIRESVDRIKNQRKSPKNYCVVTYSDKTGFFLSKNDRRIEKTMLTSENLLELYNNLSQPIVTANTETYTDSHSKTFEIKLGIPVKEDRKNCNADPAQGCSKGLHLGTDAYIREYFPNGGVVLACLFNPANVVAVPLDGNFTKMRVCEYFPYAKLNVDQNARTFTTIEQPYFETDYLNYEAKDLEAKLEKMKINRSNKAISKNEQFLETLYTDRIKNIYVK